MKYLKDKKIIALASILVLFTIVYFVVVGNLSFAFVTDKKNDEMYANVINTIKKSAEVYAAKNKDSFKKDNVIYIKVQDLIDANLLATDENGVIVNPLNAEQTLNNYIVKIKSEDDKLSINVEN